MDIDKELNRHALDQVAKYQNLELFGTKVSTPYYTNNIEPLFLKLMRELQIEEKLVEIVHQKYKQRQIPFGWYRGKGTPEQISQATIELAALLDFKPRTAIAKKTQGFMYLYGIGVDCSGFVYNVLKYAFTQVGKNIDEVSFWKDPKKTGADKAGTEYFFNNSSKLDTQLARPLDILLDKKLSHVKLLLNINGTLHMVESTLGYGIRVQKFKTIPRELELRRLNFIAA